MVDYHPVTGVKRSQKPLELYSLIKLIKKHNTKKYLEIGARHGCTFYDIMTNLQKGSLGVAVDLPGGQWGVSSSKESLEKVAKELRNQGYIIHVIFGDSTKKSTINQIKEIAETFDTVFIDGDHRYEGVKKDYENYKDFAKALISFHDIDGHNVSWRKNKSMKVEVPKLWNELKEIYPNTEEFIDNEYRKDAPMGIGAIIL